MTPKEVINEQHYERLLAEFNCSKKELDFKMALFFSDIKEDYIKAMRKKIERSNGSLKADNCRMVFPLVFLLGLIIVIKKKGKGRM